MAVDLITEHIRLKLSLHDLRRTYSNLHVMPSTLQSRGMHTIIRCCKTERQDFVFYADRLIRLVVETALGHLPFTERSVTTATGESYMGVDFAQQLCGVSIIRSGEAMENALRACCKGVKIGKMLIHRSSGDNGDELVYEKLPHDVASRYVLVMDPVLATGRSAMRAVDILIRRQRVPEEKVIFVSLIAAPEGIHRLCTRYPRMKVITSEIDDHTSEDGTVFPGVGDFGDRYFGTCDGGGTFVRVASEGTAKFAGDADTGSTLVTPRANVSSPGLHNDTTPPR